jgi:Protein of unknown function (DUF2934)
MVTKRVSSVKGVPSMKKTVIRSTMTTGIDPDVRRKLVAAEAYFLAERRGFTAGNELEDWVAAEAMVDSKLQQLQVA